MSEQKKLSTTYKLMRVIGLNYSEEEYGLLLPEKCELFSYVKWVVMSVKMFLWANMSILIYGMLN